MLSERNVLDRSISSGRPLAGVCSLLLFLLLSTSTARALRAASQGSEPRVPAGLERGGLANSDLLLGEFHCLACHPGDPARDRAVFPREGPALNDVGTRLSPSYVRAFLLDPQGEKPGTTMPAMFRGMPTQIGEEMVDRLVHFLASRRGTDPKGVEADTVLMRQGRKLFHQVGCVACHAPNESVEALGSDSFSVDETPAPPPGFEDSVPLVGLARKWRVDALARFLRDPASVRPSGRMPSLDLSREEATALSMYLLRDQYRHARETAKAEARVAGLRYRYFEHSFQSIREEHEKVTPVGSGVAARFSTEYRRRNNHFALEFRGSIDIPTTGTYRFFTKSDDGSLIYLNDTLLVDNDGHHGAVEKSGVIDLESGEHSIRVFFFQAAGPHEFRVEWEGPGIARQEIPPGVLSHLGIPMRPIGDAAFEVDPAKAAEGRKLFEEIGCVSCHRLERDVAPQRIVSKRLWQLDPDAAGGCLSASPRDGVPAFSFGDERRETLRAALGKFRAGGGAAANADERVRRGVAVFGCVACHTRDRVGGPSDARRAYFGSTQGEEMGIEGSIPPPLEGVGAKLQRPWLEGVLTRRGAVRPYMMTRMPQFGAEAIGWMAAAFEEADSGASAHLADAHSADAQPAETVNPELARHGRTLVGTKGMSCVSCHRFGKYDSLGIPATDLLTTTERLRRGWFTKYLLDPQSLRPGTRMPQFWPDGQSVRPEILDGDVSDQIDAIWSYLDRRHKARPPHGVQTIGQELIAFDEAIIYRHWIRGVGPRAIAVAYPERVNLAFDAAAMRLGLIWQGAFLDAQPQRSGRGTSTIAPLGEAVIAFPEGPPFAVLRDLTADWPEEIGRSAGYRMRGYRLDAVRRPTFLYEYRPRGSDGVLRVEDSFVDRVGERSAEFVRTLRFRGTGDVASGDSGPGSGGTLWFRTAKAEFIERVSDGEYRVDDDLTIELKVSSGRMPMVREMGNEQELVVPVDLDADGEATIEEVFRW